jgi:hypothetical protein
MQRDATTGTHLGGYELELLDRVACLTGASRSEFVRRALSSTFGQPRQADTLRGLAASAGPWRDRDFTGSEFVGANRGDLGTRRGRIGLA